MNRLVASAAALALVCAAATPVMCAAGVHAAVRAHAAADDPFIGAFEGEDDGEKVRVVITPDGKDYKGSISADGQTYAFYGVKMDAAFFVGTARPAGDKGEDADEIEFEARIDGDMLTLDHEGDKVTLKRVGKGGQAGKSEPPKTAEGGEHEPMVGTFEATFEGRTLRFTLQKDGTGYRGMATGADKDPFEATIGREGDELVITLKKPDGSGREEIAAGRVDGDGFVVLADGKEIRFKRVGAGESGGAPAAGGGAGLAGTFDAKFDGDNAVLVLKAGPKPGFFVGTMEHDGRTYDVGVTLEGEQAIGTITRRGGQRAEPFNGTFKSGVLRITEGNESVAFRQRGAPPPAPAAPGQVAGEYTATVDNEPARLVLNPDKALGAFTGTLEADGATYDVMLTITGDEVRGTIKRQGRDRTEEFNGTYADSVLRIKEGRETVAFRKVGTPGAGGSVTLPTGVTLVMPEGWSIKVDDTFSLVQVADRDLVIVIDDERLGERTHAQFVDSWTEFLEVFFLKPTEKPDTIEAEGEQRTKVKMNGERKDGTKIIGYSAVRSKGGVAVGAVIAGEEAEVEGVLRDAERFMKSLRWPGDPQVDIKIERVDDKPPHKEATAPAPAPAPAGAAPLSPDFVRVVLPAGLEFAHPEDWDIERTKEQALLTPADGGDEAYAVEVMAVEAGTDPMGPVVQRQLAEGALVLGDDAKMTGQPRAMQVAGQRAAVYTFDGGEDGRMMVYVLVSGDRAYSLTAVGSRAALTRNARTAEKIFLSFKVRAPASAGGSTQPALPGAVDDALVGAWRYVKSEVVDGSTVRTETTLRLAADGTFTITVALHRPSPGGGSTETGDPVAGEWSARAGMLWLKLGSGERESMRYKHVSSDKVEITDGSEVSVWEAVKD